MTTQISSQCAPLSRQQLEGVTILKTIVHWHHWRGGEAHCLAQVYIQAGGQTVVVMSEIRSNERELGIGADFGGVVNALFQCIKTDLGRLPDQICWIAHYGGFSSYDAVGENDRFIRLALNWNGEHFEDARENKRIPTEDFKRLIGGLELESVYQVLREIGWTKHNEQ